MSCTGDRSGHEPGALCRTIIDGYVAAGADEVVMVIRGPDSAVADHADSVRILLDASDGTLRDRIRLRVAGSPARLPGDALVGASQSEHDRLTDVSTAAAASLHASQWGAIIDMTDQMMSETAHAVGVAADGR
ncbi:hypothetical protein [Gordonia soli]|uniref:Uncharacterized protein n=1 Tax=Gordonia soli NBRC 108243 TaxID=1223545 RepID=M0QJ06_9ACTN|nr:hypothetical protein [Gordonia soli]GAC68276.1 hypothetical protein GS4_14_01070 [Gordonia soli NBRC 108243]